MKGDLKVKFDSAKIDKEFKYAKKLVGSDFDHQIFHRNKTQNNLVLITHPEQEKNYGISSTFEKFVKKHKDDKLLASIMDG